jgi:hypothetical protein
MKLNVNVKVSYELAFIGALLAVLLVGMIATMQSHDPRAAGPTSEFGRPLFRPEGFAEATSSGVDTTSMYEDPSTKHRQLHGSSVGSLECKRLMSPASTRDSPDAKAQSCAAVCATSGMAANAGSSTTANAVWCTCCRPSSRATLQEHVHASPGPCTPDAAGAAPKGFGLTSEGNIVVRDGCRGIFSWADGTLARCDSAGPGDKMECKYTTGGLTLDQLRDAPSETRRELARQVDATRRDYEQELKRRARDEAWENAIIASVGASGVVNDEAPSRLATWNQTKISRQLSFFNIGVGGNVNKWYDYDKLLAKYGLGSPFFITYGNALFKVVFNAAENHQIRNTSVWLYDPGQGGSRWRPAPANALPTSRVWGSPITVTEVHVAA